ncbi:SH3 domain-containing protein [Salinisphaera sp.]|uniref:SH3 domain-containing protein n=1 Tax=Salinisphaera sp. TaxID=1914330 RepID=UPI0025E8EFE1|nr:SH3 domain-containing protein [Salinisphaera sp.]
MKYTRSAWHGRLIRAAIRTAIMLGLAASAPAFGDDFSDAITAYQRGDYDTAHDLWAPLAEGGDARAQFNLALLYGNGLGRPLDRETARRWFEAAAEQGNVQAQYNLARMLQSGDGVQRDIGAAREWYEKAARKDFAPAQNNLALMYLEGQGMPRDRARAVRWFSRAAQSNPEARNNLNGLAMRLPQARVMAGLVNLRAGPSMQSQIIDQVSREDTGVLLDQRAGWSRVWFVDYDSIGWIADRLITIDRTRSEASANVAEAEPEAPADAQAAADTASARAPTNAGGGPSATGQDDTPAAEGEQRANARQSAAPEGPWYTVASGSAELRDEPSTDASVRDRLAYGTSVKVLEQRPGWRRVERADGDAAGWVGAFVLASDDAANAREAAQAQAEAQARAEAEAQARAQSSAARETPADVGTGGG